MDWLAVAGLWLATAVMAIKTGTIPLPPGAPTWLASPLWGYVPFALVTVSGLILLRHVLAGGIGSGSSSARASSAALDGSVSNPNILPESFSKKYVELMLSKHTEIQERALLAPHAGRLIVLTLKLASLSNSDGAVRAQLSAEKGLRYAFGIFVYFKKQWTTQLEHISPGEMIRFRAKINIPRYGSPDFIEGDLIQ